MRLDSAVSECRKFVKCWSSAGQSIAYLLQYSKKLSSITTALLQAVQQAWSLHNPCRPPDVLLRQLSRYAWLPSLCEAVMSLKDCCSTQQFLQDSTGHHAEAMQHADTAILALGSLLLAVLRWCNLSHELMHTAQQQNAAKLSTTKGAAAFLDLFQQVWCHAGVFLLANYAAVLVALLRQEVQEEQQQQRQAATAPDQQQWPGRASPHRQLDRQNGQEQLGASLQQLSLSGPQQHQQQQAQPAASLSRQGRRSTTPPAPHEQQLELPVQPLSTPSVWQSVQLPATNRVWAPPNDPQVWSSQGAYGVTHTAAAELQLLLMLWGWAIRGAPPLGLSHHASPDVLLLLLEAVWLLDVCPAAASHQRRGLCLWSTPAHMLRLLAQPVLPAEEEPGNEELSTALQSEAEGQRSRQERLEQQRQSLDKVLQKNLEIAADFADLMKKFSVVELKLAEFKQNVHEADRQQLNAVAEEYAQVLGVVAERGDAALQEMQQLLDAMHVMEVQLVSLGQLQQLNGSLQTVGASASLGAQPNKQQAVQRQVQQLQEKLDELKQKFEQQQQACSNVQRILHHQMAGCLMQLPLQLLQHLQPLTDAQLMQAALQFSRLDATIRRLVELPTVLLQAEQGLSEAQHGSQQQLQEQQLEQPGFWHKHTLPLLQLAEVYLRCQHLSRVVGLESGQLLAAVVPTTTQQLLHVLSSRHLVTALAALVITRCKVLRVVLKDTLQRHNAADSEAGEPAPATANSGGGSGLLLAHQQQGGEHGTDGSDSSSARGNSRHSHCGSGIDNAGNPCSSDSDDDSVSISSWCSSSSSILESPGVQLHEEHLAVGGMALHMLEQAAAWLRIVYVWQTYPSSAKANCLLTAWEIAAQLDAACAYVPPKSAPQAKSLISPAHHHHFAALMASSSSSSAARASVTAAAAAGAEIGDPAAAADGVAVIDGMVATILPLACCMVHHAACALQQLLPVWQQIAPADGAAKGPCAATAAATASGCSKDRVSDSHSDADSDVDSDSMSDLLPSLKDIASYHLAMASKGIWPAVWAVLAGQPSIQATLLKQQRLQGIPEQPCEALQKSLDAQTAYDALKQRMQWTEVTCDLGIPCCVHSSFMLALCKQNASVPDSVDTTGLCFLQALPFTFHEVLLAAATAAAAAAAAEDATGTGAAADLTHAVLPVQSCSGGLLAPTSSKPQRLASTISSSSTSCGTSSSTLPSSWGCNSAHCVNLQGVSEVVMPVYGCSGCRGAPYVCTYCSNACQQADWHAVHKHVCKARQQQPGSK